jgi:hypothetical protein
MPHEDRAPAAIERRFRYCSWTSAGAWLIETAAWFEQPAVIAGCRVR